jgi:hypothetical protein
MFKEDATALIERLGEEAVAWLLATDTATVRAWSLGVVDPPDTSAAVAPLISRIVRIATQQDHTLFAVATLLAQPSPEGLTMAADLRSLAGGSIAAPDSDDPIARPLLRLGGQLAGIYLLRPEADPIMRSFLGVAGMAAGHGHPLAAEVEQAAIASLSLEHWLAEGKIVMRSSGSGSTFTTQLLAAQLLTDASTRWLLNPDWPQLGPFFEAITETVKALRRVADGRTAQVPALIGVAGVRLAEDTQADLPWGVLRPLRRHEIERLPESPVETVLEALVPFRVAAIDSNLASLPTEIAESLTFSVRLSHHVALALLLAGARPPRVAMTPAFRLITDPIQGIPQLGRSTVEPSAAVELSAADTAQLESWSRSYADHHHRSLDVATRRAVGAAGRLDTGDAFIDAIIGWDNLFGSAAGESQLRIAASFARLLETDARERHQLAKQVKVDYDLRSRLVHGDISELPQDQASTAPGRALDLLLRALRMLYTERRDLLAMNSGQRSQALLLDKQ